MLSRREPFSFTTPAVLLVPLLVATNILVALAGIPSYVRHMTVGSRALRGVFMCLGPLTSWPTLATDPSVDAVLVAAVVSLACYAPLALAVVPRSPGRLLLAAILWFVAGHVWTIASGV